MVTLTKRKEAAELKMLRFSEAVTRMHKIRNENVKVKAQVEQEDKRKTTCSERRQAEDWCDRAGCCDRVRWRQMVAGIWYDCN